MPIDSLASYHLLGRSGLRVSPLCLGTMTFGKEWGWGSDEDTARAVFRRYLEAGGNFLDTANLYTNGRSEELLGKYIGEMGNREDVVLATKFTFNAKHGDPNAGGNGRKNIIRSCEDSLRRLKTDYIDLYWLHVWDTMTPAEEVMATFHALVNSGKVRYVGLSDTPAWYVGRAQTLAELRGWTPLCALQLEYSLTVRQIEREYVDAALAMGMGICPWSPLAGGFLSGKYQRTAEGRGAGEGRLATQANPVFDRFTEANWRVLEALTAVAKEVGRSPAQVALNWITKRPGVASTIIGATKMEQLEDNLAALEFELPAEAAAKLDEASKLPAEFPYTFYGQHIQAMVSGKTRTAAEPAWFRK